MRTGGGVESSMAWEVLACMAWKGLASRFLADRSSCSCLWMSDYKQSSTDTAAAFCGDVFMFEIDQPSSLVPQGPGSLQVASRHLSQWRLLSQCFCHFLSWPYDSCLPNAYLVHLMPLAAGVMQGSLFPLSCHHLLYVLVFTLYCYLPESISNCR